MSTSLFTLPRAAALLACGTVATASHASCGSAFCTLMTDRFAQGGADAHAGWGLDLRLESVTQKQLRRGTTDIDASQVSGEDAIERQTKNTNLVATLDYGFGDAWSLSLRLPLVHRDHLHDLVDEDTGSTTPEQWRFTKPGDAQLLARRSFSADDSQLAWAAFGGLKLPTGAIDVSNADGTRAERALQPGTGTTDAVLGIAARYTLGMTDALVGQASLTQALNSRQDFKPGRRVEVSVGWSHAWTHEIGSVLQLNWRQRARDRGAQAEPDLSGSTTLDVSPGLTFGIGPASTLYAYWQRPVYQKVNGVQLVPRSALALGFTHDF